MENRREELDLIRTRSIFEWGDEIIKPVLSVIDEIYRQLYYELERIALYQR